MGFVSECSEECHTQVSTAKRPCLFVSSSTLSFQRQDPALERRTKFPSRSPCVCCPGAATRGQPRTAVGPGRWRLGRLGSPRRDGGCMLMAKVVTKEKWYGLLNGCFSDARCFWFAEQHSSLQRGLNCLFFRVLSSN